MKYKIELERKQAEEQLLREMETTATSLREMIVLMPPQDLLGYIYARYTLKAIADQSIAEGAEQTDAEARSEIINQNQFLLEYVHAVLASDMPPTNAIFDETKCVELFKLSAELRDQAMMYAVISSAGTRDGVFGHNTGDIEFRAKSTWIMLRGNRHQVLEGEFYRYVLAPHDEALQEIYGAGAVEIADGFQALANARRTGQAEAISVIMDQFEAATAFAKAQSQPLTEVAQAWFEANTEQVGSARQAMEDMFRGGISNVSRHSNLPPMLLADLAYQRGEETEFFASGPFSGTPYRTLPVRKKPLVRLGSDYYSIDPCFMRDSGYRVLLYNLLRRKPDYKKSFEHRQKMMSEAAFADILVAQLPNATVLQEVYYKDPITRQWSENDTLVLLDDALFLIEAKAGAAATIASPALDFGRHVQSVQDLVVKAYKQCERFFNYLNSADEVPLYHLRDGRHAECYRIRRSDYRVMIPAGLTVESFSPFSAYCKELPQVEPLLGKHAFVSLSIDDLLVLKRFLSTSGEFVHYMLVRQAVAGMRHAHLFDEFDHLGAYLIKNRFDQTMADQLRENRGGMLMWDGMSSTVDQYFEGEDWEHRPIPRQDFPEEVQRLLAALDKTRASGWLAVDNHIRDMGHDGRVNLARMLSDLRQSLNKHPARYFTLGGEGEPLFVWFQKNGQHIDWAKVHDKARAAALALSASNLIGVIVEASAVGTYHFAKAFSIHTPITQTEENSHIYEDAARMALPQRQVSFSQSHSVSRPMNIKRTGRNDPCPCGSGEKFKRCHGR